MPAYTAENTDLQKQGPILKIRIAVPFDVEEALLSGGVEIPQPVEVSALIDTGASHTVLRQGVGAALGLRPVGTAPVLTAGHSVVHCEEYHLRLIFPNDAVHETTIVELPMEGQFIQCLIGRDVLAKAVLIYIGERNLFSLSF